MNATDFKRVQDSLEKQDECKCCDRKQKVIYYCAFEKCPYHTLLPLYCLFCGDDDNSIHNHKPKLIAVKGDSASIDWNKLRENISKTR